MANIFKIGFEKGLVTSKGPEENELGELREATGVFYSPGDDRRLHKLPGREQLSLASVHPSGVVDSDAVLGLKLMNFDDGTNLIFAFASGGYWTRTASPGQSAIFTNISGASEQGGTLHSIHYEDRHYFVNAFNSNMVVETSGGERPTETLVRTMGMGPPLEFQDTDLIPASSGTILRPTGNATDPGNDTEGYRQPEKAYDVDPELKTFATSYNYGGGLVDHVKSLTVSGFSTIISGSLLEVHHASWHHRQGGRPPHQDENPNPTNQNNSLFTTIGVQLSYDDGATFDEVAALGGGWGGYNGADKRTDTFQLSGTLGSQFKVRLEQRTKGFPPAGDNFVYRHDVHNIEVTLPVSGNYGSDVKDPFTTISGFYYGYYELDSSRGLQGPALWSQSAIEISGAGLNSIVWNMPAGGPQNDRADQYVVLRTGDGQVAPQDLAQIGVVTIPTDGSSPIFVDKFLDPDHLSVGAPQYDMLVVTQPDGSSLNFDLHVMPEAAVYITTYQDSVVIIPQGRPRTIQYSEPGLPESFPVIYEISKFPTEDNDSLVALIPLSRVLLVLMKGACLYLTNLPFVSEETYSEPTTIRIEGQPGCVGRYAATSLSFGGEPGAVWVSPYGIHMTDGGMVARITDDIDWANTVSPAFLSTAVLGWDEKRQTLTFAYDSTGNGVNDRYLLGHMNERHIKGTVFGRFPIPKWTGPHYGAINCWDQGQVGNTHRVFSGHPTNGTVYEEWAGLVDDSESASGVFTNTAANVAPMSVQTGKIYAEDYLDFETFKMSLRHSDWGTGVSGIVNVEFKRDQNSSFTGNVTKYPMLNGQRGTEFHFGRSAETLQVQVQQLTSGTGSITDIRARSRKTGKSGSR